VANVQWRDEGRYLCQLSVHPPSVMWRRLRLRRPLVHLLDGDMAPASALHYDEGSTVEMVCRVRRPPLYHTTVRWHVSEKESKNFQASEAARKGFSLIWSDVSARLNSQPFLTRPCISSSAGD